MKTPTTARRRASTFRRVGWLAVAAMATLALVGPAAGPVGAASVTPTYPDGNPTCTDLNPAWTLSFKIDTGDLANKTYKSGGQAVVTNWAGQEITLSNLSAGGQVFDWSSTLPVSGVLVKAGNANNALYTYAPPVTSDTGLTHGLGQQGISHLLFCGSPVQPTPEPTPTPTPEPTPTPTPGADAHPDARAHPDPDPDPGADAHADARAHADPDPGADAHADPEPTPDPDPGADAHADPEPTPDPDPGADAHADARRPSPSPPGS